MKRTFLALIKMYQAFAAGMRPRCRFWPSCSQYAYEAIEAYGAKRGAWLALRRFARCHPFGGHGIDPVPLPHS